MARGFLTFGGVDSRDYGVYISGTGVYNAPAREYTRLVNRGVPGMPSPKV